MPELPIHPDRGREAPGYALERRLGQLKGLPEDRRRGAHDALREAAARETLRLTGAAGIEQDPSLLEGVLSALSLVESTAASGEELRLPLIREVHRLSSPPSGGEIRTADLAPQFQNARILSPRFIESRLQNLLDWLHGDSGRGMFPAERMALWFPRFLEIAPFERGNFRTAHLLLSFFSCADRYPPVSLRFEEAEAVRGEVERAFLFDTGPLVDRFSSALSRSLETLEKASVTTHTALAMPAGRLASAATFAVLIFILVASGAGLFLDASSDRGRVRNGRPRSLAAGLSRRPRVGLGHAAFRFASKHHSFLDELSLLLLLTCGVNLVVQLTGGARSYWQGLYLARRRARLGRLSAPPGGGDGDRGPLARDRERVLPSGNSRDST